MTTDTGPDGEVTHTLTTAPGTPGRRATEWQWHFVLGFAMEKAYNVTAVDFPRIVVGTEVPVVAWKHISGGVWGQLSKNAILKFDSLRDIDLSLPRSPAVSALLDL